MRYSYSFVQGSGNGGGRHWKLNLDGAPTVMHIHDDGTWDFQESNSPPSAIIHAQEGYIWLESYCRELFIRRGGADRQVPESQSSERKLVMLDNGEEVRIRGVSTTTLVLEVQSEASLDELQRLSASSEPQMFNTCPEAVESFPTTPPDTILNTATQVGASQDRNNKKRIESNRDEVISSTPPEEISQPLTKASAPPSISQGPSTTHHKALLIPETSVESSGLSDPPSTRHPPSIPTQSRGSVRRKRTLSPPVAAPKTKPPSADPLQPPAKRVMPSSSRTSVVVSSGVSGRALTALKGLVKSGLIQQADSLVHSSATHLVFGEGKFRRNAKALLAIAGGLWIVSDAWILDSKLAAEMVPVEKYLLQHVNTQGKSYCLPSLIERYRLHEGRFLADQGVYVSEDTQQTWESRGVLDQMWWLLQLLGAGVAQSRKDAHVIVTDLAKDHEGRGDADLLDPEDLYNAVLAGGVRVTDGRMVSA